MVENSVDEMACLMVASKAAPMVFWKDEPLAADSADGWADSMVGQMAAWWAVLTVESWAVC